MMEAALGFEPDRASEECRWILRAKDHSYHRQQPEWHSERLHLREARASVVFACGLRNVVDSWWPEMAPGNSEASAQGEELIVAEMTLPETADNVALQAAPD